MEQDSIFRTQTATRFGRSVREGTTVGHSKLRTPVNRGVFHAFREPL